MSGKSPPTSKSHVSWFSRFRKRASSPFSPPSPASPSCLPCDSTGKSLDIPAHCADADVSVHSTTNSIPAYPSPSSPPSLLDSPLHLHPPYTGKVKALENHAYPGPTPSSVSHRASVSTSSVHSAAKPTHTHPPQTMSSCPPDSLFRQYPPRSGDTTARIDGIPNHHNDPPPTPTSRCLSSSNAAVLRIANSNPSPLLHPSPPASPLLPKNNGASLEIPHRSGNSELLPSPSSHPPSVSRGSAPSSARTTCAGPTLSPQRSICCLEDSTSQGYFSAYPIPPTPLARHQGQAVTYQGPSVSVMLNSKRYLTMFISAYV
jgi:hypothetical protein